MSDSASIGGSKGSSESSTQVDIPEFLRPFLQQGANTASGALNTLQGLAGGSSVAGFNPLQQQAQQQAVDVAGGAGGFLPTAQQTFLDAAQGSGLSFLPQSALASLTGAAQVPGQATDALTRTAGGDFLFGGQGFDQAVQAAVRAAQPAIASTFGRAGPGGVTSGLAQEAIGQSAIDAFASQFARERQNQLGAADSLANRGLQASGLLGDFATTERGRQLNAAGQLPSLALFGSDILSDVGGQQQAQAQREIDAPFFRQLQLLSASLGGLPISSLLGQSTEGSAKELSFGSEGGK